MIALKPVPSRRAFFLEPVLFPSKESYERWRMAVATIPQETKRRIRAFVSDGFRGSKLIAREHGWIHQCCHFHLLMALIRRHGRRSYRIKGAGICEKLLGSVEEIKKAFVKFFYGSGNDFFFPHPRLDEVPKKEGRDAVEVRCRDFLELLEISSRKSRT